MNAPGRFRSTDSDRFRISLREGIVTRWYTHPGFSDVRVRESSSLLGYHRCAKRCAWSLFIHASLINRSLNDTTNRAVANYISGRRNPVSDAGVIVLIDRIADRRHLPLIFRSQTRPIFFLAIKYSHRSAIRFFVHHHYLKNKVSHLQNVRHISLLIDTHRESLNQSYSFSNLSTIPSLQ